MAVQPARHWSTHAESAWQMTMASLTRTLRIFDAVSAVARDLNEARTVAWLERQQLEAKTRLDHLRMLHPELVSDEVRLPVKVAAPPPSAEMPWPPLTRRETRVAALIAQGFSNRQIADELVLAEGSVANYVAHILRKLDCANRAQVAAWAVRQGLSNGPAHPDTSG